MYVLAPCQGDYSCGDLFLGPLFCVGFFWFCFVFVKPYIFIGELRLLIFRAIIEGVYNSCHFGSSMVTSQISFDFMSWCYLFPVTSSMLILSSDGSILSSVISKTSWKLIFWSCLLGVPQISSTWIGISFISWGVFFCDLFYWGYFL